MKEIQVVVFNLNNEVYGIDSAYVKQIVRYQDIAKLSEVPDFVSGTMNLRGQTIPVIDLNKKFNLGGTEINKKTKIIVTEIENTPLSFIVNDVLEILRLTEENLESSPSIVHKSGNAYLTHVAKSNDRLISLLNLSMVLTKNEISIIDDKIKEKIKS
jgi:purine-binding chemotaxis protein CheW